MSLTEEKATGKPSAQLVPTGVSSTIWLCLSRKMDKQTAKRRKKWPKGACFQAFVVGDGRAEKTHTPPFVVVWCRFVLSYNGKNIENFAYKGMGKKSGLKVSVLADLAQVSPMLGLWKITKVFSCE